MDHVAFGTVTGTGTIIDIDLGWTPDRVVVRNLSDTLNFPQLEWVTGMPAGSAVKRAASTFSRITTLGISQLGNGANDTKRGFRIGTDATVNVAANMLAFEAYRAAEPKRV